ncbi:hypothetical protein AHAS_Ahas20G0232700 [Arachis hypogaea]
MTTHVMWRTKQLARNKNGEGAEDNLGDIPRTLATFLKVDPPVFNGSTDPTEADNCSKLWSVHCKLNMYRVTSSWNMRLIN